MTTLETSTEIASQELLTPLGRDGATFLSGAPALTSRGVRGINFTQQLFLIILQLIFFTLKDSTTCFGHISHAGISLQLFKLTEELMQV